MLEEHGVAISMDGRGRWMDNVFVERLWRSLKYEEVYLHAYETVAAARAGIGGWLRFYNEERLHRALDYRTPSAVFAAARRPRGYDGHRRRDDHIPTGPTAATG